MPSETYEFLEKLSNGDYSEIYSFNYPDELIGRINESSKNPRSTQIIIEIDNDEKYLNILGIDNEDDIWIWNRFIDNSHSYDHYSWDRYRDDFFEGYIFDSLNQENLRLISKIRNLTPVPQTKEQDTQHKLEKYLDTKFYSEIDDIIGIFQTYNDDCVARAVQDILINETKNPFQKFGIVEIYPHHKFKTTVGILLNLYKMMNAQELDLSGLLKEIDQKYNNSYSRGDWYELEYNSWCDDFDSLGMNNEIKIELEKIIEQIEETINDDEDFKNYNELFDAVFELGGFERWINLPQKRSTVNFQELKTNPTRLKFLYNKPNKGMEARSVKNLEELNMMLYQGELFENVKKTLRKLL